MKLFSNHFPRKSPKDKFKKNLISDYNSIRPANKHGAFCWAPFTSLRFHRNGNVQVCCHHFDFFSLKERSLKQIWFGEELQLMRKQMSDFKAPASCNFCNSNFYNHNFSNVNALSFDHYAPLKSGYPVFMDFSIDNTCNLACIMCDASLSSTIQKNKNIQSGENQFQYDEQFIQQLDEFIPYLKGAVFTGGEPFLINTYYGLWEKMVSTNPEMDIYITTNGTIYNKRVQDLLNSGRFNITVSIDSFTREVYEKIRVGANFEKTMGNIAKFSDYCRSMGTQFTITTCPMQINAMEIPRIVDACNRENWNFSYNIVLKPWNLALWSLSPDELNNIIILYDQFVFNDFVSSGKNNNIEKYKALIELYSSWYKIIIKFFNKQSTESQGLSKNFKTPVYEQLIQLFSNTNNHPELITKVNHVLDKIPDMLFTGSLLKQILSSQNNDLMRQEFVNNDADTISDHLTIMGFNSLLSELTQNVEFKLDSNT